jgi:hypothetical protein
VSEMDADLRDLLSTLSPGALDALPHVLIRDQPDPDEVASTLLHYGDRNGMEWADVIDMLTMYPDQPRRVVSCSGSSRPGAIRRRSRSRP